MLRGVMTQTKTILYFGFIGASDIDHGVAEARMDYMGQQMHWLALKAPDASRLFLTYTAPEWLDGPIASLAKQHGFDVLPELSDTRRRNTFEYPGFLALSDLAAKSEGNDLIFYCHSKGIVELSSTKMGLFKLHTEVCLAADLSMMTAKAGLFPSEFGWVWNNIFWAKAWFLQTLTVPESANRYTYEALIGDKAAPRAYETVLQLIDLVGQDVSGIPSQPFYQPHETASAKLIDRYRVYSIR